MDRTLFMRIWPVFVEEAREHLQQIGAGILQMEQPPEGRPAGLLDSLRRTAHSLKGSAASLGLTDIEKWAHVLETALVGRDPMGQLEPRLVETALAGVEAVETALARGDAGEEPRVEGIEAILAALSGEAPLPKPAPKKEEPGALEQVWDVFRTEAREHVAQLKEALAGQQSRGAACASDEMGGLARIAGSLKGSASVLGLKDMERIAGEIEQVLGEAARQRTVSPQVVGRLRSDLEGLEALVGGPGQAAQSAAPEPAPRPARVELPMAALQQTFRAEAEETLAALEGTLSKLCSPFDGDRRAEVDEATRRAHNLKGSAGAVGAALVSELAAKLHGAFPKLAEPGLEASRAAATLAGALVDLQQAIAEWGRPAPADEKPAEPKAEPRPEAKVEPEAAGAGATGAQIPADRVIRVSVNTLESLARQIEGMTISRSRLDRRARDLQNQAAQAQEMMRLCEQMLSDLRFANSQVALQPLEESVQGMRSLQRGLVRMGQELLRESEQERLTTTGIREDLKDLRMVPASTALEPLRRTVRETAGRVGKQVELRIAGGDVRLDRRILDQLKDPLLHMVRNAIDHGLEETEQRRKLGKNPSGLLELRVERRGHRIAVVIADDGSGLPADKVRAAAVRRGLVTAEAASRMEDAEALRLIFRAGLSTAEKVTNISGRGIGLDVVHEVVTRLGGTVDLDTVPGKGTTFTLVLPLTLAATMAVVVRLAGELAALPYEAVERILRLKSEDLGTVAGRASVTVEEAQVPFASLAQVLGLQGRLPMEGNAAQPALLVEVGGQRVVFAVEEVVGQQEIVVQSLGRHIARTAHLGGAAVLDDGKVVPVFNAQELVRLARPMARSKKADEGRTRILIADDSLTTRSAMKAVLEIAGYQVLPAGDGEEAWQFLQESPCQLVVTDVQMPRMDGLALTRRVKGDARFARIPVILVTSLDSAADRAAGLDAGADGYLVKREVERGKLLDLVRQLLPGKG